MNSVCSCRMLPFTFNKTQLIKPQKIMDLFVIGSSSYTKGNQRYLPSKLGGGGCIHLYSHAKASSQFWLKKLFSELSTSISSDIVYFVLSLIGLKPKDLLYACKWELKIITNILKNFGLNFWSEIILNISLFSQVTNSAIKLDNSFTANLSDIPHNINRNFDCKIVRNFSKKI